MNIPIANASEERKYQNGAKLPTVIDGYYVGTPEQLERKLSRSPKKKAYKPRARRFTVYHGSTRPSNGNHRPSPWPAAEIWRQNVKRLYINVLIQAFQDIQKPPSDRQSGRWNRAYRDQARAWFMDPDELGVFSFRQTCFVLGLRPRAVLQALAFYLCPVLPTPRYDHKKSVRVLCR